MCGRAYAYIASHDNTGRASGRHLSRSLRLGTTFDVRIVADVFDNTITVYDSNRLTYPRFAATRSANICVQTFSDSDSSGSVGIQYDKCIYENIYVMRKVQFFTTNTHIRETLHEFHTT